MTKEELYQLVALLQKLIAVEGLYCPLVDSARKVVKQLMAQRLEDVCR